MCLSTLSVQVSVGNEKHKEIIGKEKFLFSYFQSIHCEEIVVGDLVKVYREQDVPCDLLLLFSTEDTKRCYITTSNLDGETNLKVHNFFLNRVRKQVIIDLVKRYWIRCVDDSYWIVIYLERVGPKDTVKNDYVANSIHGGYCYLPTSLIRSL